MNIKFEKHIDWEPLVIRLMGSSIGSIQPEVLRDVVAQWLAQRDKFPVCQNGCWTKYQDVRPFEAGLQVSIQWICKDCVGHLLKFLDSNFPEVERATIGYAERPVGRIPMGDGSFVKVPSRVVTMEDGEQITTKPFSIAYFPISVGEFESFATEAGYVTSAERVRHFETYKDSGYLFGMNATNRYQFEAKALSYVDAIQYCERRRVRLPSDVELLAAITVDDVVREITGKDRATLFRNSPQLLRLQGLTLTSTCVGDEVVARLGPWVTKQPGWDQLGKNRFLRAKTLPIGQFYVVKESTDDE